MKFQFLGFSCLAIVFSLFCTNEAAVKLPNNETVSAVIVFGDSIVDPGNNNNLITLIKCDFPPYGRDFMGGKPTGRFNEGKIPTDLMVEELGIKELLPAYLDPNLQPTDLPTGVSFASGGAGYDPFTSSMVSVLTLSDQLRLYEEYLGKLKSFVGEEKTSDILSKAIFLVVASSDDIANNYFGTPFRRLQYNMPSYADLLVNYSSSFVQDLYNLGARKIGVFSAPPIGCVPSQRTLAGGILRNCATTHNQLAQMFNGKLSSKLDSLKTKLPQAKVVYLDIYTHLLDIIENPRKYGFEVVDRGCCGTGMIETTILCNRLTPVTCPNVSEYVFWDSYHPTELAYKVLVHEVIQKYVSSFF